MRLLRQSLQPALALALAVATLVVCVTTADAFSLRSPQYAFNNGALQFYFNSKPQSINTLTDQLNAQSWSTTISGNSTFTFMVELTSSAFANSIGIYNTLDPNPVPPLFLVFPGAAQVGWFATCHFENGNMLVTLFDNHGIIQGQTWYLDVSPTDFGFYLQRPGVLFFSDDSRNGGKPQMLTYAGDGSAYGTWWECFEDQPYNAATSHFVSAVLSLESVLPVVPTNGTSWGRLKSLYR